MRDACPRSAARSPDPSSRSARASSRHWSTGPCSSKFRDRWRPSPAPGESRRPNPGRDRSTPPLPRTPSECACVPARHSRALPASPEIPAPRPAWQRRCRCCRWWRPAASCPGRARPRIKRMPHHRRRGAVLHASARIHPLGFGQQGHSGIAGARCVSSRISGVLPMRSISTEPYRSFGVSGERVLVAGVGSTRCCHFVCGMYVPLRQAWSPYW